MFIRPSDYSSKPAFSTSASLAEWTNSAIGKVLLALGEANHGPRVTDDGVDSPSVCRLSSRLQPSIGLQREKERGAPVVGRSESASASASVAKLPCRAGSVPSVHGRLTLTGADADGLRP